MSPAEPQAQPVNAFWRPLSSAAAECAWGIKRLNAPDPALEKSTASSRGQILDGPDVFFESPSEATALLRVEQTTQSNDNPTGQTFTYVMQLSLVDTTDQGWKADRVEILSQQTS